MALDTVQKIVDRARALLLDQTEPYRYSDEDLVQNLNMAVLEARRIRPDIFRTVFRSGLPEYASNAMSTEVAIDEMYRPAFVYYVVGQAQLRDDEEVSDQRATIFLNKFASQLLSVQS